MKIFKKAVDFWKIISIIIINYINNREKGIMGTMAFEEPSEITTLVNAKSPFNKNFPGLDSLIIGEMGTGIFGRGTGMDFTKDANFSPITLNKTMSGVTGGDSAKLGGGLTKGDQKISPISI